MVEKIRFLCRLKSRGGSEFYDGNREPKLTSPSQANKNERHPHTAAAQVTSRVSG